MSQNQSVQNMANINFNPDMSLDMESSQETFYDVTNQANLQVNKTRHQTQQHEELTQFVLHDDNPSPHQQQEHELLLQHPNNANYQYNMDLEEVIKAAVIEKTQEQSLTTGSGALDPSEDKIKTDRILKNELYSEKLREFERLRSQTTAETPLQNTWNINKSAEAVKTQVTYQSNIDIEENIPKAVIERLPTSVSGDMATTLRNYYSENEIKHARILRHNACKMSRSEFNRLYS